VNRDSFALATGEVLDPQRPHEHALVEHRSDLEAVAPALVFDRDAVAFEARSQAGER
jgi:hypothetical protein